MRLRLISRGLFPSASPQAASPLILSSCRRRCRDHREKPGTFQRFGRQVRISTTERAGAAASMVWTLIPSPTVGLRPQAWRRWLLVRCYGIRPGCEGLAHLGRPAPSPSGQPLPRPLGRLRQGHRATSSDPLHRACRPGGLHGAASETVSAAGRNHRVRPLCCALNKSVDERIGQVINAPTADRGATATAGRLPVRPRGMLRVPIVVLNRALCRSDERSGRLTGSACLTPLAAHHRGCRENGRHRGAWSRTYSRLRPSGASSLSTWRRRSGRQRECGGLLRLNATP